MKCKSIALILLGFVSSSHVASANQERNSDFVESSQKMVEQWLSIERQTSALESNWASQKPMLQQRLLLLEAEKKQLQGLLNEKSTDSGQVEQKRTRLIEEQSQLEASQQVLEQSLNQLSQQLNALQPYLAPPIQQAWQQESVPRDVEQDTSIELQLHLAQLNKLAEFDQRVSVIQASIENELGESILVKQLFLGASIAWFVSLDGSFVGTGYVTESGWNWIFDSELNSEEISTAIAMFEQKQEARFINLPFQLNAKGAE